MEAYRTAAPERGFDQIDKPDWITFTSSSTVQNFVAMAGAAALTGAEALTGVKVASIGPVTSATARQLGIEVAVEAKVYTTDGLVQAILAAGGAQ